MKYVKHLCPCVALAIGMALMGCTTGGDRLPLVIGADAEPDLVSTLEYLPKREMDEEGQWRIYEPSENPYAAQRGRVQRDAVVAFIEARRAYKDKLFEQAQPLLEELAEQYPGLSGPWVLLGDVAIARGNHEEAVEAYVEAININRDNVNAYLRLARAQRLMGQFLHAQNTYAQVLFIWPDFPEAHLNLAVLYDVYLNHPLRAQKHMEAYQFLNDGENGEVAAWLTEIRQRTGIASSLYADSATTQPEPLSYADQQESVSN